MLRQLGCHRRGQRTAPGIASKRAVIPRSSSLKPMVQGGVSVGLGIAVGAVLALPAAVGACPPGVGGRPRHNTRPSSPPINKPLVARTLHGALARPCARPSRYSSPDYPTVLAQMQVALARCSDESHPGSGPTAATVQRARAGSARRGWSQPPDTEHAGPRQVPFARRRSVVGQEPFGAPTTSRLPVSTLRHASATGRGVPAPRNRTNRST